MVGAALLVGAERLPPPPAVLAAIVTEANSGALFFNLGVEAGQAMVVAALFPALLWFSRFTWERRAVTAISATVFVAAMALAIERVVFAQA